MCQITFDEVMNFMERKGIDLQARLHGYARRDIETFGEYLSAIEVYKIKYPRIFMLLSNKAVFKLQVKMYFIIL